MRGKGEKRKGSNERDDGMRVTERERESPGRPRHTTPRANVMQKCLHLIDFTSSGSSRNVARMLGLIEDEPIFRQRALKESECPKVRK